MTKPFKRLLILYLAAIAIAQAVSSMGPTDRPVGDFAEAIFAVAIVWIGVVGPMMAGIKVGVDVADRTRSSLLGWLTGVPLMVSSAALWFYLFSLIPGMKDRIIAVM